MILRIVPLYKKKYLDQEMINTVKVNEINECINYKITSNLINIAMLLNTLIALRIYIIINI